MQSSLISQQPEQIASPAPAPGGVQAGCLLLPLGPEAASLDYDQFQRYSITAQVLDLMLAGLAPPVRVLEVGCNVLNLFPLFLDPDRVQVTRCDVEQHGIEANFVLIERDKPLPFANESFDAVAVLDVLEHIPASGRRAFVAECLRVARRGAVLSCPNGSPEVRLAEEVALAAYQHRHGRPHPFLLEHRQYGVPSEEEVTTILAEFDYPYAVLDNSPLELWLAMLLLSENLAEKHTSDSATSTLHNHCNQALFRCLSLRNSIPYRKIYVCAKTFDATRALSVSREQWAGGSQDTRLSCETSKPEAGDVPPSALPAAHCPLPTAAAALQTLAQVASEALSNLENDYQSERTVHQAQVRLLENELAGWRQQHAITHSLLTSATQSLTWKLLAPLRTLRCLLKPRGFDASALIPWQQLEPIPNAAPGTWLAQGTDPQFLVPCWLPAGWVRIRLKMTSPVQGRAELYAETGAGFSPADCIERISVVGGVNQDFFVHFASPVRAIRLDPLDVEGEFHLESLRVDPVPGPVALVHAFFSKLRLIWENERLGRSVRRGLGLLLRGRFDQFRQRLVQGLRGPIYLPPERHQIEAYETWRRYHQLTDADRARMRAEAADMPHPPLISVLMPVYNTPEPYLSRAIESVLRQTYPHWELCITDDASTAAHIRLVLEDYTRRDDRVRVVYRPKRGHIAAASNSALALARGDYIALLDHDDEIAEQALFRVAQAVVADRGLDMIYSDEDKLELDGRHVDPFFKPDWSPEYFLTCMYTCHLGVYRTALVRELGGFRSEFDTAQDYDLALRIVARSSRIGHIPDVLYHWRKLPHSTAVSHVGKPQANETARRALVSYLKDVGRKGSVEPGPINGLHRVRFALVGRPKISIVIPTACRSARIREKETTYIAACVESIRRKSTYKNYEIIVVDNDDMPPALRRQLDRWNVRHVTFTDAFNLASKINLGAAKALGDHLVLLNDDIEVIDPDWLECLLEYSQQQAIGAVGAKLLFPDGRLQHVGVTIQGGNPIHPFYGNPGHDIGYCAGNVVARNFSAVTGACMMTRAEVFHGLGGFDESFPLNYNDVDYCLRLITSGRRVVFTPYAKLYHHEGATKPGLYPHELHAFKERWDKRWNLDPYYNPNLSNRFHDYRIQTEEEIRELQVAISGNSGSTSKNDSRSWRIDTDATAKLSGLP